MAIGSWGTDVIFSVSDKRVLTFNDMQHSVGSAWATHSRIGLKDQVEYLRPTLPDLEPEWPDKPLYITPVQGRGMSETTLPTLEPDLGTAIIAAKFTPSFQAVTETRLPTLEEFETLVPVVAYERTGAHFSSVTETRLPPLKEE